MAAIDEFIRLIDGTIQKIAGDGESNKFDTPSKITRGNIKEALESGLVTFVYFKVEDNLMRVANGTRNERILREIPSFQVPKGNPVPEGIIVYWDTERDDWRSFRANNFLGATDFLPESEAIE